MSKSETTGLPLSRTFADMCRTLRRDLFSAYRPELHYMRGPGPKWCEKHGAAPIPVAPAIPPTVHGRA
jgi:hypothetical protein